MTATAAQLPLDLEGLAPARQARRQATADRSPFLADGVTCRRCGYSSWPTIVDTHRTADGTLVVTRGHARSSSCPTTREQRITAADLAAIIGEQTPEEAAEARNAARIRLVGRGIPLAPRA